MKESVKFGLTRKVKPRNNKAAVIAAKAQLTKAKGEMKSASKGGTAMKRNAKANVIRAKGELAKAKTAATRTKYRSAAAAASAASLAEAYRGRSATQAMLEWQRTINGGATPATGTGEPNSGSSGVQSGDRTESTNVLADGSKYPIGNYARR